MKYTKLDNTVYETLIAPMLGINTWHNDKSSPKIFIRYGVPAGTPRYDYERDDYRRKMTEVKYATLKLEHGKNVVICKFGTRTKRLTIYDIKDKDTLRSKIYRQVLVSLQRQAYILEPTKTIVLHQPCKERTTNGSIPYDVDERGRYLRGQSLDGVEEFAVRTAVPQPRTNRYRMSDAVWSEVGVGETVEEEEEIYEL